MLLVRTEHRGHHATGIAEISEDAEIVFKKAVEATKFVASEPYKQFMEGVSPKVRILLGHTRHATHSNAHQDDAAHPFQMGKIIGAHNGVIYNWKEVEQRLKETYKKRNVEYPFGPWVNDSQAAFGALNWFKKPEDALDVLNGWMALTWTRNKALYFARGNSPELAAAYVAPLRTLFWNSEMQVLRRVLFDAGIHNDDVEAWPVQSYRLYRYDPMQFDAKGTNAQKRDVKFKGMQQSFRDTRVNGANPNQSMRGGWSNTSSSVTALVDSAKDVVRSSSSRIRETLGGIRENNEQIARQRGQGQFGFVPREQTLADARREEMREREKREPKKPKKQERAERSGQRNYSIAEIVERIDRLEDEVDDLNERRIEDEGKIEAQKAEIDFLYEVLNEYAPDAFEIAKERAEEAAAIEAGEVEPAVDDEDEVEAAWAEVEAERAKDIEPPKMIEPPSCVPVPTGTVCAVCKNEGEPLNNENALFVPGTGDWVHSTCVFPEEGAVAAASC